jgi:predicted aldo/keto reductase-like oxidoreductase
VVQIQLNYMDYDDPAVASRECLAVLREFGKPAIVMEPVKGGSLARLPEDIAAPLAALGGSPASYALRFAAACEGVELVLSGMGTMAMLEDNMKTFLDPAPLDERETRAVIAVREALSARGAIPCTACEYCTAGCPMSIPIPKLFAAMNTKTVFGSWNPAYYYGVHTQNGGKASSCIGCGACEAVCPQHLKIRDLLKTVAKTFEK